MNRRSFLSLFAALPVVGKYWNKAPEHVCKSGACLRSHFVFAGPTQERFFSNAAVKWEAKPMAASVTITRSEIDAINADLIGYMSKKKTMG